MKFLGFDKVLCLSPHPDDVEISIAGTIMKYTETKFTSIVFSTGSVHDPVANETRWNECKTYWEGFSNIQQFFLAPLLKMFSEEEWLNLLEKNYPLKNYEAILLPPELDTHYEHRLVHNIGMAMTRVTPASVIEYKAASALDTWIPNLFIEINEVATEKVERLKFFESQNKSYFRPSYMKAFHTHLLSLKKGKNLIEQFRVIALYENFLQIK